MKVFNVNWLKQNLEVRVHSWRLLIGFKGSRRDLARLGVGDFPHKAVRIK